MTHEQQAPAGTTVSFTFVPPVQLAADAGFDWLVTPLQLTAAVVPLNAACTELLRGLPVSVSPLTSLDACSPGEETVQLTVRFRAPFTVGAYRIVFLVDNVDAPVLHLELDAGQLFVTPKVARGSRAPSGVSGGAPAPAVPESSDCGCQDLVVDTLAARDLIPLSSRCEGVAIVYVRANQSHWVLIGGIANSNWVRWQSGASLTFINGGSPGFRGPLTPRIT